ncbi:SRR1-like protein [Corticium candelabrum]|uniref:SRR1-like protein n=1 Tax=Corticium candelabrum TaxID=121492 RepID=UPI002E26B6B9|nr:SRR1-like protein [Corticium candelabrum]
MSDDDFILVRYKARERRGDRAVQRVRQKGNHKSRKNAQSPVDAKSDEKCAENEMLRVERCKREVKESEFYAKLLSHIHSSSLKDYGGKVDVDIDVVCYGLGLISTCPIARYQFSLLVLLTSDLNIECERCHVYDPAFDSVDHQMVVSAGFSVIDHNEEGRRCVDRRTVFYMPHCGKLLYDNVLRANWSRDRLSMITIIGNKFSHYRERLVWCDLEREAPCIAHVLEYVTEREVSTCFQHRDVFNDLAIHDFTVPADVCEEFWTNVPDAVTDPCDCEIVRAVASVDDQQ